MKKYFVYELKKSLPLLLGLSAVCLVLSVISFTMNLPFRAYDAVSILALTSTVGGLLAALLPIRVFRYKMKKRSVDLYFSLPISHTKIIAVKFLLGLVLVFVPYAVTYWCGVWVVRMAGVDGLYYNMYIAHFLSTIIPIYLIYAVSSFIFTRANNTLDGIIFIVFWALLIPILAELVDVLTDTRIITYNSAQNYYYTSIKNIIELKPYFIFSPLDDATSLFQDLLRGYKHQSYYGNSAVAVANAVIGYTITTAMGIGSTVGIIIFEKNAKAENCQQISESLFGYKTMIPIYTSCCLAFWSQQSFHYAMMFSTITIVAAYLTSALYRRNILIGKQQLIIFAISIGAGILLSLITEYATPIIYC